MHACTCLQGCSCLLCFRNRRSNIFSGWAFMLLAQLLQSFLRPTYARHPMLNQILFLTSRTSCGAGLAMRTRSCRGECRWPVQSSEIYFWRASRAARSTRCSRWPCRCGNELNTAMRATDSTVPRYNYGTSIYGAHGSTCVELYLDDWEAAR